jgi:hypothetical protein
LKKSLRFILLLFLGLPLLVASQELNCAVQVLTPQIQTSDRRIFETLQTSVMEFMNNRKWTTVDFLNQERIDCSITITINERLSGDEFRATIQVQARRPVFKTSYYSPLLNFNDQDFAFKYAEFQPLEFNDNIYQGNLTSTLAFYAYIILGLDYDSFSMLGGTPYFQKAFAVASAAQSAPEKGWKAFESSKNRYWLGENLLNDFFKPVRETYYRYHRKAMDILTEKPDDARKEIKECIELVRRVANDRPNSFLLQLYFNTKADELVNVFSKAFPDEKTQVVNALNEIDPANTNRYQNILKN